ncbi:hypothetical protein CR513_03662, partial [Mucuna pruriens]
MNAKSRHLHSKLKTITKGNRSIAKIFCSILSHCRCSSLYCMQFFLIDFLMCTMLLQQLFNIALNFAISLKSNPCFLLEKIKKMTLAKFLLSILHKFLQLKINFHKLESQVTTIFNALR